MITEYVDIIKIVFLVLDIICALFLLRFVIKGIKKGFARNLFTLIALLVYIALFIFLGKPIIQKALHIELPINFDVYEEEVSASSIVNTVIVDNVFAGDYQAFKDASIAGPIEDIMVSAVSIVLFGEFILLVYWLLIPISIAIFRIFIPSLRKKKDGVKIKYSPLSKSLGVLCAVARYVIFMMIFVVPIYGVLEIGDVVIEEAAPYDEDIKQLSVDVNAGIENSVMYKITSNLGKKKTGAFGVGAKTVGARFLIQTEYGNINFINEIDTLGAYFPRAMELVTIASEAETYNEIVDNITEEDVTIITNYLADSKLIHVVYPIAMNIVGSIANEDEEIKELGIDFHALAKIDINKDLASLQPFFIKVLHCAKKIDLDNLDVWEILNNHEVIVEALDAVDVVLNLEITEQVVLKIALKYLNEALIDYEFEHLTDLVTNDYIRNNLITDIKSIYSVYELLEKNGIIDLVLSEEDITEIEITEDLKNDLKQIIDTIFNLELIKTHEKKIVQTVFMFVEIDEELLNEMLTEDIDWGKEVSTIGEIIVLAAELVLSIDFESDDYLALLGEEKLIDLVSSILEKVITMELTEKYVLPLGVEYLEGFLEDTGLEELNGIITTDYIKNNLINDLKELVNVVTILDETKVLDYFLEEDVEFEYNEEIKTKLLEAFNKVLDLELISQNEKALMALVLSYVPEDLGLDIDAMLQEDINWTNEAKVLGEVLVEILDFIFVYDFTEEDLDYVALLSDEELVNKVSTMLEKILTMELTEEYILPLCVEYLEGFLEDTGLEELNGIITTDYIKNSLINDLKEIVDVVKTFEETKIIEYFKDKENSDFVINEEIKTKLLKTLNKVLDLELISQNEKALMKVLLSYVPEDLGLDTEAMLQEDINWTNELKVLVEVLVDILEFTIVCDFNTEDLGSLIKQEEFKTLVPELIEKIFHLQISEKYLSPILIKYLSEMLDGAGFGDFANYITTEYLKNDFSLDIEDIFTLYDLIEELGLSDSLNGGSEFKVDVSDPVVETKFRTFVSTILNLRVLNGHESELVKKLCELSGLQSFIPYDESIFDNVDWDVETENFVNVVMAVLGLSGIDSFDENYLEKENFNEIAGQLSTLFDALIACSFTKEIAFELVHSLTESIGYEIVLSEADKMAIVNNTGKVEFDVLTSMMNQILELMPEDSEGNIDYTTIKGSDITNLMTKASEGIIASKIMGTVLNTMLGEDGLDIMPVDPVTGEKLYDFTDPNTLREQAVNIGNCIDLVNNLASFNPDSTDSITGIIDSLGAIAESDSESNIVEDLLTEFLPIESTEIIEDVDWEEEASLVEEILNMYDETEDKDDFSIDDEELKERLEDSSFAGIILDFLEIFN